jgi:hypothetical protein
MPTTERAHHPGAATDDDPRWDWDAFRLYMPDEPVTKEGYPLAWVNARHLWAPRPNVSMTGLQLEADDGGLLLPVKAGIKDMIRDLTGHRCIRCGHPYVVGQEQFWDETVEEDSSESLLALTLFDEEPTDEPRVKRDRPKHWSPCDDLCTHGGLFRWRIGGEEVPWTSREGAPAMLRHLMTAAEVQAAWRILTVHHLDGNKRNCLWWNLASLCQRCHLTIQKRVVMEQVWPTEHSEWFKIHAAAWYATKYEHNPLVTRAEARARMDELLAYERQV